MICCPYEPQPNHKFRCVASSSGMSGMVTQYITIQKIPLKTLNLLSLCNDIPFSHEFFMTKRAPSCAKKHHESTEPENDKTPKRFFFLSSIFFFYARTIVRDSDNTEIVHLKKED